MTEPAYLAAVRESYDTVAAAYLERVPRPHSIDPVSRAMLAAFAELVREADLGPVADLGCGPGLITGYLTELGLSAFGVDVSPNMVEQARAAHPDLRFTVGSMTALDLPDGGLGGILAWFSTHHTPPEWLPAVYAEFHRVLAPGGRLLLGGWIGDNVHRQPKEAYGGLPVSYESHLVPADRISELLREAGLCVGSCTVQTPAPGRQDQRQNILLLARRPERP